VETATRPIACIPTEFSLVTVDRGTL